MVLDCLGDDTNKVRSQVKQMMRTRRHLSTGFDAESLKIWITQVTLLPFRILHCLGRPEITLTSVVKILDLI